MATQAHCAFCFETLIAYYDKRESRSLEEVEEQWNQYVELSNGQDDDDDDAHDTVTRKKTTKHQTSDEAAAKPAALSRLLGQHDTKRSATSSSSSLPSSASGTSSVNLSDGNVSDSVTPASSNDSLPQSAVRQRLSPRDRFPLFVTWNTHSRNGQKNLRGCIGTFEAQELEAGLANYALTSALQDTRFSPIPASLLPQLSVHVTLLTNFSQPVRDPMDWTLGKHGIRISFTHHGRRYGATYLPDVAKEQGWTKEETIVSLMHKAGWNGSRTSWRKTWDDGRGELIRYEGKAVGLDHHRYQQSLQKQTT